MQAACTALLSRWVDLIGRREEVVTDLRREAAPALIMRRVRITEPGRSQGATTA